MRRRLVHPGPLVDGVDPEAGPLSAVERVPARVKRIKHRMRVRLVASFQMDYPRVGEEARLEADEAEVMFGRIVF